MVHDHHIFFKPRSKGWRQVTLVLWQMQVLATHLRLAELTPLAQADLTPLAHLTLADLTPLAHLTLAHLTQGS